MLLSLAPVTACQHTQQNMDLYNDVLNTIYNAAQIVTLEHILASPQYANNEFNENTNTFHQIVVETIKILTQEDLLQLIPILQERIIIEINEDQEFMNNHMERQKEILDLQKRLEAVSLSIRNYSTTEFDLLKNIMIEEIIAELHEATVIPETEYTHL